MRILLLFLALIAAAAVVASASDQVLLPVIAGPNPIPGAHGSMWLTQIWVSNVGASPVTIFSYCGPIPECVPTVVDAGATVLNPYVGSGDLPTTLLTAIAGDMSNLRVSIRAMDMSRQSTSAGTEIPTVPTTQFNTGVVHLVGIPVDSRFRLSLRVYSLTSTVVTIRARSLDEAGEPVFFEMTSPVTKRFTAPEIPGYLQLDNFLSTNAAIRGMRYFRLEIASADGAPIWAFGTVTNNDTEQLTTITPNH